jgi:rhamnose transport system permease protein
MAGLEAHGDRVAGPAVSSLPTPGAVPRKPLAVRLGDALRSWETMLLVLLAASLLLGRALSPDFLSSANLGNLLANLTEIALMALGMTLLVVAGEIDLSVASVLGLASALLGVLWQAGLPFPLCIAAVLLAGAIAGAFNGWLVTQWMLPSLAVTIGTMALFRGLAYILLGDAAVADFPAGYTAFGFGTLGEGFLPLPWLVLLPLAAAALVLLQHTAFGRSLYAMGANETAARFSGIATARSKAWLFVASGTLSALAGVMFTLRFSSARGDNGMGFELQVVAAVLFGGVSIFGGRGSLAGVLLALLILGVLTNALTLYDVSNEILTIVTGLLLLSSVLVPNLVARWREAGWARRHRAVLSPMATHSTTHSKGDTP